MLRIEVAVAEAALLAPGHLYGQPRPGALEVELQRIARGVGGRVGVAAIHLETGAEAHHEADAQFFMASTYKIPIAATVLARVDQGELRLDSLIPVGGALRRPVDPGAHLAMKRYLELMLILSDNTATDVMMRTPGRAGAVTSRMRAPGVQDLRVDRPAMELTRDLFLPDAVLRARSGATR